MKKIKKFIVNLSIALGYWLRQPRIVLADAWSDSSGATPAKFKDLEAVFARVVQVAIPLAGIVALMMLIVAGFQYLTAGEDPKAIERASKTLTSVFLGLILVIGAWLILKAIETITGVKVTIFKVYPD